LFLRVGGDNGLLQFCGFDAFRFGGWLRFSSGSGSCAGRFTEKVSAGFYTDGCSSGFYTDGCSSSDSDLVPDAFPYRVSTISGSRADQRHAFGRCPQQLASGSSHIFASGNRSNWHGSLDQLASGYVSNQYSCQWRSLEQSRRDRIRSVSDLGRGFVAVDPIGVMFLSLASIVPDLLGFYSSTSFIFIFNGVRLFFFFLNLFIWVCWWL
jgi:hypothetical protein